MKIGVIGVGNIAKKAYLPTYAQHQGEEDFYFATRNPETQQQLKESYGFTNIYTTLDELIAHNIDACFIHAATPAHYALAKQCLMNNIHVCIDKPLSTSVREVAELQELAEEKGLYLMIGFNRRFAPMTQRLKEIPEKRLIQIQKNRVDAHEQTEYVIYDLFLHAVDTAVYLLDEPIQHVTSKIIEQSEELQLAMLTLETDSSTAIVTMDLRSGANTETYQVTSPKGTYILKDLTNLTIQDITGVQTVAFGDWETTLYKRGFAPMVEEFLKVLHQEDGDIKQKNTLLSHKLCAQMIREHTRHQL
ncbi:MAG: Gfo/Idh/MocA family protein [Enterococcus sp.]